MAMTNAEKQAAFRDRRQQREAQLADTVAELRQQIDHLTAEISASERRNVVLTDLLVAQDKAAKMRKNPAPSNFALRDEQ